MREGLVDGVLGRHHPARGVVVVEAVEGLHLAIGSRKRDDKQCVPVIAQAGARFNVLGPSLNVAEIGPIEVLTVHIHNAVAPRWHCRFIMLVKAVVAGRGDDGLHGLGRPGGMEGFQQRHHVDVYVAAVHWDALARPVAIDGSERQEISAHAAGIKGQCPAQNE